MNDKMIITEDVSSDCSASVGSQGPFIGIWWADGSRIVAILQSPTETTGRSSLRDSDLNHFEEWTSIAHHFQKTPDEEYFVVPRGRVLLDAKRETGIIYHGNSTQNSQIERIAAMFGYTTWEGRIDDHYLTGDAADRLLDDMFDE